MWDSTEKSTKKNMIKKWKIVQNPNQSRSYGPTSTVSFRVQPSTTSIKQDQLHLNSDNEAESLKRQSSSSIGKTSSVSEEDSKSPNVVSTENIQLKRPRKPRRHTTGGTKQAAEDIKLAKDLNALNIDTKELMKSEMGENIDPDSTLGRKQLISMLKKRYGSEMEEFRNSGVISEKEKIRKQRQTERDKRHEQRISNHSNYPIDSEYPDMMNGRYHYQANGYHSKYGGSESSGGSEMSDNSLGPASPQVTRARPSNGSISKRQQLSVRSNFSDDEHGTGKNSQHFGRHMSDAERTPKVNKAVVFLQYDDEVKRVQLPSHLDSLDAIKLLFVNAFPGRIAIPHFENGSKLIYIKDGETGVYYDLEDYQEVVNRSFLKIHEKEIEIPYRNSFNSDRESTISLQYHDRPHCTLQRRDSDVSFLSDNTFQHHDSSISLHSDSLARKVSNQEKNNYNSKEHLSIPVEKSLRNSLSNHSIDRQNSSHSTHSDELPNKSTIHENHQYIDEKAKTSSNEQLSKNPKNNKSENESQRNPLESSDDDKTHSNLSTSYIRRKGLPRGSSQKRREPTISMAVEEQLDDLSDLLKTALSGDKSTDESVSYDSIVYSNDTKRPGKLDPSLIGHLQNQSENSKKMILPSHYKPAVLLKAQDKPQPVQNTNKDTIMKKTVPVRATEIPEDGNLDAYLGPPKGDQNHVVNSKSDLATDLLDQLNDLEDVFSKSNSPSSSITNSRRSSTSSDASRTHISVSSVKKVPKDENRIIHEQSVDQTPSGSNLQIHTSPRHSKEEAGKIKSVAVASVSPIHRSSLAKASPLPQRATLSPKKSDISTSQDMSSNEIRDINSNILNKQEDDNVRYSYTKPYSKHSTSSSSSNENIPVYSQVHKPTGTPNTNSKLTTTFGATRDSIKSEDTTSNKDETDYAKVIEKERYVPLPSLTNPDFKEMEESARDARDSLRILKKDFSDLRQLHLENTKVFKADIQRKLLQFRKKASRLDDVIQQKLDVNNNVHFANKHPVREQRHRVSTDQMEYSKKLRETKDNLRNLESDMEITRLEVVEKKRVDDPQKVADLHERLTNLTKGLADSKNRFYGLHDMLKNVMKSELEIIKTEEKFLLDEPNQLDELVGRCKALSTTLFTLQKLANVQNQHNEILPPSPMKATKSFSGYQPDYQEIEKKRHHSYRR